VASRIPPKGSLFAGRYRVDSVLGQGGMGVVLTVIDEKTNVTCALKLVSGLQLSRDAPRLIREARALMLISSAHVVRVFDVDEVDGVPYVVLEKLDGQDLFKLAADGQPMPPSIVALYATQVCDALSQAHAVGIIHRDIKLSNLFLAHLPDGSSIIKVLDFGISKAAPGDELGSITSSHQPLGSPQFISPEQLRNPKAVDARTDLWSLGVVMFRLLSGRYPFEGKTALAVHKAIARGERPTLAEVIPDLPREMLAIVERCLSPDPAGRHASAAELGAALRPLLVDSGAPVRAETSHAPAEGERASTTLGHLPLSPHEPLETELQTAPTELHAATRDDATTELSTVTVIAELADDPTSALATVPHVRAPAPRGERRSIDRRTKVALLAVGFTIPLVALASSSWGTKGSAIDATVASGALPATAAVGSRVEATPLDTSEAAARSGSSTSVAPVVGSRSAALVGLPSSGVMRPPRPRIHHPSSAPSRVDAPAKLEPEATASSASPNPLRTNPYR
jgi:eukaryotic-like serine/threonine-protein kinase